MLFNLLAVYNVIVILSVVNNTNWAIIVVEFLQTYVPLLSVTVITHLMYDNIAWFNNPMKFHIHFISNNNLTIRAIFNNFFRAFRRESLICPICFIYT